MKIVVFGSRGMLGRYVSTYFKRQGYEVKGITRDEIDVSDFSQLPKLDSLIKGYDVVINCIGTIKPAAKNQSVEKTFMVNAIYPHYLARVCSELLKPCFHITTDCVFCGGFGNYNELSEPNMYDDYGLSKSIGDFCSADFSSSNCFVIRTSIIGEELENKRSLIEWAKSQKGKEVNGFIDHLWNGVTCLQLAKVIHTMIESINGNTNEFFPGTRHIYSDTVNKAELLQLISDTFDLDLKINAVPGPYPCNRTLSTVHTTPIQIPKLRDQLKDLVGFYNEER